MSEFALPVPSWNDILQLKIIGSVKKNPNHQVEFATEEGVLCISMLESGFRIQTAGAT